MTIIDLQKHTLKQMIMNKHMNLELLLKSQTDFIYKYA